MPARSTRTSPAPSFSRSAVGEPAWLLDAMMRKEKGQGRKERFFCANREVLNISSEGPSPQSLGSSSFFHTPTSPFLDGIFLPITRTGWCWDVITLSLYSVSSWVNPALFFPGRFAPRIDEECEPQNVSNFTLLHLRNPVARFKKTHQTTQTQYVHSIQSKPIQSLMAVSTKWRVEVMFARDL